jgi:hypothetical protein
MKQILTLSILLLAASPVLATTMVMGTDDELFGQAELIAEGTVLAVVPSPAGLPATGYRVRVERTLKGRAPAGELLVRVPGGAAADGRRLIVWGAPAMQAGERVLLFLDRYPDGDFGPLDLAMGAFYEVVDGGRHLALRDLSEMQDVSPAPAPERARDFQRFAGWLADRAAGLRRPADYFVNAPASGLRPIHEKFTYLTGIKQRWTQFDAGQSVGWRALSSGQPGLAGGGFAELQAGLQAWNNDAATNIRYRYDGTTNSTSGFQHDDGVNAIIFDDPNREVSGSFVCSSPGNGFGVLALGGTWIGSADGGRNAIKIEEGDIIINDGAGCWFTTSKRAEQVYGHELGHTLGLGHSCGDAMSGPCTDPLKDDALMRANAHADERGARLNADDQAGIFSLYSASGSGGKPAAPTGLTATAASATSIRLDWLDNAFNETSYRVEMKTTGSFQEILSLPAETTSTVVTGLAPQTAYTFRVRARNDKGASAYSNEATATTPPPIPAAPTNLTASLATATEIRLDWSDNSHDETGFRLERSSPATGWTLLANLPPDTATFTAPAEPDTPYSFRVRAEGAGGSSAFSNPASITVASNTSAPCAPGAEDLCLLGGRFRVTADWRTPDGNSGAGQAVPQSDQTGLFWFFGADNIELIVKVLDGRPVTPSFWVFYGGLSNVEYWITVTDTQTAATKTYHNEQGNFCGNPDVNAFPAPSSKAGAAAAPVQAAAALQSTGCGDDPGALCLFGDRFKVTVTWNTGESEGAGTPVPLTDQSGLFWFFSPENIELVVKVIDGRPVNNKLWVFYGALSNVEYQIEVTDTTNGATKTYHNASGNFCGQADVNAFDG